MKLGVLEATLLVGGSVFEKLGLGGVSMHEISSRVIGTSFMRVEFIGVVLAAMREGKRGGE